MKARVDIDITAPDGERFIAKPAHEVDLAFERRKRLQASAYLLTWLP